MNDDLSVIKSRIKKLLALSKSPNENEAAAALEKARKIMEEYHFQENECLYTRHSVKAVKRLSKWRSVLGNAVAWLYYCETYRDTGTGEQIFFGDEFDAFMAGEMFGYLVKTIERMAKQNIRKNAKYAFRERYKLGIACQLGVRIKELGADASWAPQREKKLLAVRKAMEGQVTVVTKSVKLIGNLSGAAFQRGVRDGKDISLNRQTTGHGGRFIEEVK
jgi:hypothetical protein